MSNKTIEFILPIYNEEGNIEHLYSRLVEQREKLKEKYVVSFLFINDGSKDNSLEMLLELAKKDNSVRVVNFARNFGHEMAITAGLDYANADAIIMMDADLQDPPEVALELVKEWEKGSEVVYAQRRTRKDTLFKKATASIFYELLSRFAEINIPKETGNFRLMDKKVVDSVKSFRERNRFMRGLVSYVGFKQTAVLFDRKERYAGETHYPLAKMVRLSLDALTSFSTIPLNFILQAGFICAFISMAGIVYALISKFLMPAYTVSGWTTIMLSVLFVGSIQMIMLGIIGIYIGRIYREAQHRPLYIVSSIVEHANTVAGE